MSPKQGEIWLADLGLAAKTRPVVIVSCDDDQRPRDLHVYVPCTTQNRNSAYEVSIGAIERGSHFQSVVNVQGIGSLPRPRFIKKLGSLRPGDYERVRTAMKYLMSL